MIDTIDIKVKSQAFLFLLFILEMRTKNKKEDDSVKKFYALLIATMYI